MSAPRSRPPWPRAGRSSRSSRPLISHGLPYPAEPRGRQGVRGGRPRRRRGPGHRRDPCRPAAGRPRRSGPPGARHGAAGFGPQGRSAEPRGGAGRWRLGRHDRLGHDDRRPRRGHPRSSRRAGSAASIAARSARRARRRAATFDISSDLEELGRTPMAVVCAGPKAILDVPATLEYLETRGVPVVAVGQADLPGFYARSAGIPRRRLGRRTRRRPRSSWPSTSGSGSVAGSSSASRSRGGRTPRRCRPGRRRARPVRAAAAAESPDPRSRPGCSPGSRSSPTAHRSAPNTALIVNDARVAGSSPSASRRPIAAH